MVSNKELGAILPFGLFKQGVGHFIAAADRARGKENWLEAAHYYGKAVARDPERFPIWVQYGHALKESGDRRQAEDAYRKALALAPHVADTHLQLGHVLKLLGQTQEALVAYRQAIAYAPHDLSAEYATKEIEELEALSEPISAEERDESHSSDTGDAEAQSASDNEGVHRQMMACYGLLLGRMPTGDEVAAHRRQTVATVLQELLKTDEFRSQVLLPFLIGMPHPLDLGATLNFKGDWLDIDATFDPPIDLTNTMFHADTLVCAAAPIGLRLGLICQPPVETGEQPPVSELWQDYSPGYSHNEFDTRNFRPDRGQPDLSKVIRIVFGGHPGHLIVRIALKARRGADEIGVALLPQPDSCARFGFASVAEVLAELGLRPSQPPANWTLALALLIVDESVGSLVSQANPQFGESMESRAWELLLPSDSEGSEVWRPATQANFFDPNPKQLAEIRTSLADLRTSFPGPDAAAEKGLWDAFFRQGAELLKSRALLVRQSHVMKRLQVGLERYIGHVDWLNSRLAHVQADRHLAQAAVRLLETRILPPTPRKFRVLFVSGDPSSTGHEHRVENFIIGLERNGIEADWISFEDCDRFIDRLAAVSIIVFRRTDLRPSIEKLIVAAERLGILIVYDIDDYVFEPSIATPEYMDGLRFLPPTHTALHEYGTNSYRDILIRSEFAIFPTRSLVARGEALGRRSFLLPNGLDPHYQEAAMAGTRKLKQDSHVIIGYAPGSRTHQRDVAVAAPAIARVLAENPLARLRIIGDFDVDEIPVWRGVRSQIELDPTLGRHQLRVKTIEFDINIAPVEIGNPFTEAKSELKYFEPACFGVPTVASATSAFRDSIQNGETGFLAVSEADWYTALSSLVRDQALRERVGAAARKHALRTYSLETLGGVARHIYSEMIRAYRSGMGRTDGSLVITIMLPMPIRHSDKEGHVIALASGLSRLGHDVALYFKSRGTDFENADDVRDTYGLLGHNIVVLGEEVLRPADVAIAATWDTAQSLNDQPDSAAVRLYLVEDFGTYLSASGDDRSRIEKSYDLNLQYVARCPWLTAKLRRLSNQAVFELPCAVDKSTFTDRRLPRASDHIVLCLSPDLPLHLVRLSISAVQKFILDAAFVGKIDILGDLSGCNPPFAHSFHASLSRDGMAELFNTATIGVAASAGNPSETAIAMMACGLPVVDIDHDGAGAKYGSGDNVWLVASDTTGFARGLTRLFEDESAQARLSKNAAEFAAQLPLQRDVTDLFDQYLRRQLALYDSRTIEWPEGTNVVRSLFSGTS